MSLEHRATNYALEDGTEVISSAGLVDGRDPSTDGSKLDAIEEEADVTDATNVSAAGAGMIAESKAWTASQRSTPTTLVNIGGNIVMTATDSNLFVYTIDDDDVELALDGAAVGMRWTIKVIGDGVHGGIVTWPSGCDWGETGAPTFSGLAAGEYVLLDMVYWAVDDISCAISEVYGS